MFKSEQYVGLLYLVRLQFHVREQSETLSLLHTILQRSCDCFPRNDIKLFVFTVEMHCVYCEIRNGLLRVIYINLRPQALTKVLYKTCFVTRPPANALTYTMRLI
jgi:hypothetical protein